MSLALPPSVPVAEQTFRSVMIRVAGRPVAGQEPLLAGFTLEQARMLTLLETKPGRAGVVMRFAALIQTRPAALDVLTYSGTGAISLRKLTPYVLSLSFGANDGIALDNFVSACSPADR